MPKRTSKTYKYCIVPMCKNTTESAPNKLFLTVPKCKLIRDEWCRVIGRTELSHKTIRYCCEDHFNLEDDVGNYMEHKIMNVTPRLKSGVLPTKFISINSSDPPTPLGEHNKKTKIEEMPCTSYHIPAEIVTKNTAVLPIQNIGIPALSSSSMSTSAASSSLSDFIPTEVYIVCEKYRQHHRINYRKKKCIGRHDQFQERTDLESSKIIAEIKVKSEEDEEGINSFDKDNDQSKSVLERSEIKIEVVEHDIKQEVLQDDSIDIEPKLNSNNSMNNMALKLEDNRMSGTSRPETLLLDSEENGTRIKSEFVKCESAYDADMCDESEINCDIAAFQLHTDQNLFK